MLSEFDLVSETDIMKYITKSPAKSCSLDEIPTWFIKQNAHMFVLIITDIVNPAQAHFLTNLSMPSLHL